MTQTRRNIFVIHSWDDSALYHRLTNLLSSREAGLADYSVPPWKAIEGNELDIAAGIRQRITTATAVVVLNTPGLHKRPWSSLEMEIATAMGKRIIVLQPPDCYTQPIPDIVDAHLYRVVPWRSDVIGRAIRGEYPQDMRTFDIAEVVDRRRIIAATSVCVGAVSFALFSHSIASLHRLEIEFRQSGIELSWSDAAVSIIGCAAGIGLAAGFLTAVITEDPEAAMYAAGAGALVGAAIGARRVYEASLEQRGPIHTLTVECSA